jgi:hypothetical protein
MTARGNYKDYYSSEDYSYSICRLASDLKENQDHSESWKGSKAQHFNKKVG